MPLYEMGETRKYIARGKAKRKVGRRKRFAGLETKSPYKSPTFMPPTYNATRNTYVHAHPSG